MRRDLRQIAAFFGGLVLVGVALALCSCGSSSPSDKTAEQIASKGLHEVCRVLGELERAAPRDAGAE